MTPPPVTLEATTGDPELDAMAFIVSVMRGLDPVAQGRVVRWATARYGADQASDG